MIPFDYDLCFKYALKELVWLVGLVRGVILDVLSFSLQVSCFVEFVFVASLALWFFKLLFLG